MLIYFGADHGGFELKERLKKLVQGMGYEIEDLGAPALDPADDYADYASVVARKVAEDPRSRRGILACYSGAGRDITANKIDSIRCILGFKPDQVYDARHDDDVNVLALASDRLTAEEAETITKVFLEPPFAPEERFVRRINKNKE